MKTLIALAAVAALTGCAVAPAPAYYASAPVSDPYQWHTVSVTPVGAAPVTSYRNTRLLSKTSIFSKHDYN